MTPLTYPRAVPDDSAAPTLGDSLGQTVADLLPDAVTESAFDPGPAPAHDEPAWWGGHVKELRWQAELTRLVLDPVWYGRGVPRGTALRSC